MKKLIAFILITVFLNTTLSGCGIQKADDAVSNEAKQEQEEGVDGLFTYDEENVLQFNVKSAIPGEEETYQYPWGEYDDPIEAPSESEALPKANDKPKLSEAEMNEKLQASLDKMTPEQQEAAKETMRKALEKSNTTDDTKVQEEKTGSDSEEQKLPDEASAHSNQPDLGGRLEFENNEDIIIIEMSEYSIEADTTFTVIPVKENKLSEEFMKNGFLLTGENNEKSVKLDDYAVITFITKKDPGEDVVLKSIDEDGRLEYTYAEVRKIGDTYRITGAVEHFSTVGYGSLTPSPELEAKAAQEYKELSEQMAKESARIEKERKWLEEYKNQKFVDTIEFDEILFTNTISGDPCQLHLRAKLVEQPTTIDPSTNAVQATYKGKIWVKCYINNPAGYGDFYYLSNNAKIDDPFLWETSKNQQDVMTTSTTFTMATTRGSNAVSYELGSFNVSGKTYSNVQTNWEINEKTGNVKVTFTTMKGMKNSTFITGKLSSKTKKQAAKKLKWFLD